MRGDKAVSALPESGRFQTDSSNSLVIDDPSKEDSLYMILPSL